MAKFTTHMAVRDYECDMQSIVNNAVYQHYLEHARHEFLKHHGLSFADLTQAGINVVVTRAEIDYRRPLRSGDAFVVTVQTERESRLRLVFLQRIERADGELMLEARIVTTAVNGRGRPYFPEQLKVLESLKV